MGLFVVACGIGAGLGAPPTPTPRPSSRPNPHLSDPASAETVFTAIARAKLPIAANNAAGGQGSGQADQRRPTSNGR